MEYENFIFTDKLLIESRLKSANNEDIIKIIIGAVNGIEDWEWLQNLCLKYVNHDDFWVSKTAISSIGDIVRIFGKIDEKKVENELIDINNTNLREIVNSTLEDILIFAK